MRIPSQEIKKANDAIENALENANILDRGDVAQTALSNLRNLVEHVLVYSFYRDELPKGTYYEAIKSAVEKAKSVKKMRFAWQLHRFLQKTLSHYTPSVDSSERLLLRYYEYLLQLKQYAAEELNIEVLTNVEKFPLDIDPGLSVYYRQIAECIDAFLLSSSPKIEKNRYYVHGVKPFFVGGRVYYEVTLVPAYDKASKFDHIIAFSKERIPGNYSVSLSFKRRSIDALGVQMTIYVIDAWATSIRPCELNGIAKILGVEPSISGKLVSYQSLMVLITETGMTLDEIALMEDFEFDRFVNRIAQSSNNTAIFDLLVRSHKTLKRGAKGSNVLRYLLYRPRNRVIGDQLGSCPNNWLGFLCLDNKCLPFENFPFSFSLAGHRVSVRDVSQCVDSEGRDDELLARHVANNARISGSLYTAENELESFDDIDSLIKSYNSRLYSGHGGQELVHEMGYVFIREDEESTASILHELVFLSEGGLAGYAESFQAWLNRHPSDIDDGKKIDALESMYVDTRVALVYGSAGTGKTTIAKHLVAFFSGFDITAIAATNPAVDNLRRKIPSENCECMTVAKYLYSEDSSDVLIIDECSTVSNRDMRTIVERGAFRLLLLVGDVCQIESIDLGNWFELAKTFLPKKCIHEFCTPFRTSNDCLIELWSSVRGLGDYTTEILEANGMTSALDGSVFEKVHNDEIVLCLNYDGLYGINNVNRLLQRSNNNEPVAWGLLVYKVGDPVLFNESNRFHPLLYNNLKGVIEAVDRLANDEIIFDISIDQPINGLSTMGYEGLSFVGYTPQGRAVVRFSVHAQQDPDNDEDESSVVPFQIAYAASIHKAQGLEYDSVKLIITKDVEESISHNIFYTAITRARKSLIIFWSPETQEKVLRNMEIKKNNKDACLLANRCGLIMHPGG